MEGGGVHPICGGKEGITGEICTCDEGSPEASFM